MEIGFGENSRFKSTHKKVSFDNLSFALWFLRGQNRELLWKENFYAQTVLDREEIFILLLLYFIFAKYQTNKETRKLTDLF